MCLESLPTFTSCLKSVSLYHSRPFSLKLHLRLPLTHFRLQRLGTIIFIIFIIFIITFIFINTCRSDSEQVLGPTQIDKSRKHGGRSCSENDDWVHTQPHHRAKESIRGKGLMYSLSLRSDFSCDHQLGSLTALHPITLVWSVRHQINSLLFPTIISYRWSPRNVSRVHRNGCTRRSLCRNLHGVLRKEQGFDE